MKCEGERKEAAVNGQCCDSNCDCVIGSSGEYSVRSGRADRSERKERMGSTRLDQEPAWEISIYRNVVVFIKSVETESYSQLKKT